MFYQGASDFAMIKIGLASPDQVRFWSHGEVEKPETINYRTFKPEKKGLFCEKIFGPVKDWECSCGKYRRVRYRGITCERCGVEITHSRVRRERMGHIELAAQVAHIWYLKGIPSYMSILLNMSSRELENIIYYDAYVVTEVADTLKNILRVKQILPEQKYYELKEKYAEKFKAGIGASAVRELLTKINLEEMIGKMRETLKKAIGQKRLRVIRRLSVAEAFYFSGNRPEWMILTILPVMPPDLRPMVQLEGGRFATSDLNDLYRRVINRNNRLKRLMEIGAPDMIIKNEKRMLQEAVDVLIDNGRRGRPVTGSTGRPLKSLSDIIEGKQGRFRQNLLGKRVDYSGRSVIVVGPGLKMYQCGVPKEMALELFKPFVISQLVEGGFVQNVKTAKRKIELQDVIVWDVLERVIKNRPVMLNRAPTLHRLGVQAFEPILVRGKAIQIHPLVCTAFNADFDGDQMAIHVPLSLEAVTEARLLMLSSRNLLSPASGRPIVTPTQDMVLGCHYLTIDDKNATKGIGMKFANEDEAILAFDSDLIDLHAEITVRKGKNRLKTTVGRVIFNKSLNEVISRWFPGKALGFLNLTINKGRIESLISECYQKFGPSCTADVADEIKKLGFKYATLGGISIAIEDLQVPEKKKAIIDKAKKEIEKLEKSFRHGQITRREKYIREIEIWSKVTEEVTEEMLNNFNKLNSVYMMAFSGARGSVHQVRQLAGIRGLMADPAGNIIDIPITSNFKEGLNVTEYFISSYGARKGLVDTALRTADSGYLTRRLVDVAQDVMITEEDCKTKRGILVTDLKEGYEVIIPLENRITGRFASEKIEDPETGKEIARAGQEITEDIAKKIVAASIEGIWVRSVLTCQVKRGVCQICYGRDLSSGELINIGEAVGIIAAQSIGEPGTQLTMRTFHTGGIALHKPTKVLIKAKHTGTVDFESTVAFKDLADAAGHRQKIVVTEGDLVLKLESHQLEHYFLPVGSIIKVSKGDKAERGLIFAEYDPTFHYVIALSAGKVAEYSLDVKEKEDPRTRKSERVARKDGEIIIYNSKVTKEFKVPADSEIMVAEGDKVDLGTSLIPGLTVDLVGYIYEIKKHKDEIVIKVHPGEKHPMPAGSRILVEPGDTVEMSDILAKIEVTSIDKTVTKDIVQGLPRVEELFEARKPKDTAILAEIAGRVRIEEEEGIRKILIKGEEEKEREYIVPYGTRIKVHHGQQVQRGEPLTEGLFNPHDIVKTRGIFEAQKYLVEEIQKVYRGQGVEINDKHVEVIVRQMSRKVKVAKAGDTNLLPGQLIGANEFEEIAEKANQENQKPPAKSLILLGITKASLNSESFISAASFQETTKILTEAAIRGKIDRLYGLKENVIIGKLIPAGTGFPSFRFIDLQSEGGGSLEAPTLAAVTEPEEITSL